MKLNQVVENLVERLGKYQSFSLDPSLSKRDKISLLNQVGTWALRGSWKRQWFREAKGLVLLGSHVKISYPHYLSVGRNFIVEDFAEIMALSSAGIVCGDNVTIGAFATIKPSNYYGRNIGHGLKIGRNSNIGRYSYIGCSGFIQIGDDVLMGPRVGLFAENHVYDDVTRPMRDQGVTREIIIIEDDCWLASSSTVLAGVTVGRGSVVAAGSVVTSNVPSYSIVAGAPARVIGDRREISNNES
jgi:acetyltransferase-like isoleucine patch superfamily enzyme